MNEADVKPQTYLIALDDEIDLLKMFQLCMKPKGYDVDITTDEDLFWQLIKVKKPSVIFLDIQMPGKQGTAFCRELKANEETSHIPVVFLSGKEDAFELASDSCADGCIRKPFNSDVVVAELKRILCHP